MRLLERYVLVELCRVFGGLLSLTTLLLVFVGVFGQVREHGLGPWQVLQILPFIVPSLLPYTIPVTLLLTVCVVYGRMAGDREIIAAKAAGIHVMSLMWPSFFLGGLLSVASLLLADQIIPWSYGNIERIVTMAMEDIFLDLLRTQNQVNIREAGVSITVMGVQDRTLICPIFRYSPNGRSTIITQAQEAKLSFDLQRRQVLLQMKQGYVDAPGEPRLWFEVEEKPFKLPARNSRLQVRNLRLSDIALAAEKSRRDARSQQQQQALEAAFHVTTGDFHRLREDSLVIKQIKQRENLGLERRYRTEYYTRFSMSMSCLFFVLVGSPFAILAAKKQFLTSFLFVFTPILVVYYPVTMMTQNLSKTGALEPSVSVWAANFLLLIAAAFFLREVSRN
jgi:lipopolysaccharide export system permease protein